MNERFDLQRIDGAADASTPSSSGLSRGSAAPETRSSARGFAETPAARPSADDLLAADPRGKPEDDGILGSAPTSFATVLQSFVSVGAPARDETAAPPPLTPPHKGEGGVDACVLANTPELAGATQVCPSPLWGGVRGG